jgi:hypothetical protein
MTTQASRAKPENPGRRSNQILGIAEYTLKGRV